MNVQGARCKLTSPNQRLVNWCEQEASQGFKGSLEERQVASGGGWTASTREGSQVIQGR